MSIPGNPVGGEKIHHFAKTKMMIFLSTTWIAKYNYSDSILVNILNFFHNTDTNKFGSFHFGKNKVAHCLQNCYCPKDSRNVSVRNIVSKNAWRHTELFFCIINFKK